MCRFYSTSRYSHLMSYFGSFRLEVSIRFDVWIRFDVRFRLDSVYGFDSLCRFDSMYGSIRCDIPIRFYILIRFKVSIRFNVWNRLYSISGFHLIFPPIRLIDSDSIYRSSVQTYASVTSRDVMTVLSRLIAAKQLNHHAGSVYATPSGLIAHRLLVFRNSNNTRSPQTMSEVNGRTACVSSLSRTLTTS